MRYYPSADVMSRALDLPLLLRVDPDLRFLERHDRLSGYAVEAPFAARILHRTRTALGATTFENRTVIVCGPFGTLEHLPWAVGLASQLSDLVGRSYLLSAPLAESHGGAPRGDLLPAAIQPLAEQELRGPAIAVATDLANVRLIVKGEPSGARVAESKWTLIVAQSLPEELEGAYAGPGDAAGTILVASFRDHGVYELECAAQGLRRGGHRLLGVIAIGPEGEIAEEEPPARHPEPMPSPSLPPPATPAPPTAISAALAKSEAARTEGATKRDERAASGSHKPVQPAPLMPSGPELAGGVEVRSLPSSVFSKASGRGAHGESPAAPPAAPSSAPESSAAAQSLGATRPTVPLLTNWEAASRKRARLGRVGAVLGVLALVGAGGMIALPRLGLLRGREPKSPKPDTTAVGVADLAAGAPVVAGDRAGSKPDSGIGAPPERWIEAASEDDSLSALGERAKLEASVAESIPEPRKPREIPFERQTALDSLPGAARVDSGVPRRPPFTAPDSASRATRRLGEGVPRDTFVVHLSSFRLEREAHAEISELRKAGVDARTVRVELSERGPWYRVVTGRFATFSEAEAMAVRLCQVRGVPRTHVVGQSGRGEPIPIDSLGSPDSTREGKDSR